MQARQAFLGWPEFSVKLRKIGDPGGWIYDPGRLREHHAIQIRIGAPVHRVDKRGRVNRQLTGIVKLELRLDQAPCLGVCREKNEIDILPPPRVELQWVMTLITWSSSRY